MIKSLIVLMIFLLALWCSSALAADCIDIELGAQVASGDPFNILSVYFFALNCGTEPGVVTFMISLEKDSTPLGEV